MSFGEEAEEDEEESVELSKKLSIKSKSAHDNLEDPKLSAQPVIEEGEPSPKRSKADNESSSENDIEQTDEDKTIAKEKK